MENGGLRQEQGWGGVKAGEDGVQKQGGEGLRQVDSGAEAVISKALCLLCSPAPGCPYL